MSWKEPKYFREHGSAFLGSQSPAVTLAIRDIVDRDIADEPARTQRIERALQADFVLAALFAIYCSAIFLRRRTDAIKESALDTSAAALRGFRKIKGRTKALVSEIDHRSRKN